MKKTYFWNWNLQFWNKFFGMRSKFWHVFFKKTNLMIQFSINKQFSSYTVTVGHLNMFPLNLYPAFCFPGHMIFIYTSSRQFLRPRVTASHWLGIKNINIQYETCQPRTIFIHDIWTRNDLYNINEFYRNIWDKSLFDGS
jgi:hypothetical protein